MASPIPPTKQSVDLSETAPPRSRIRRDPPAVLKLASPVEVEEREARTVVIGVIAFALALFVITLALSNAAGWSPSQYTWHINQKG